MSSDGSLLIYRRAGGLLPKRELRAFASSLTADVAEGRTFTCLLTDDRELARLNQMFLSKAGPTDVLSFPSGEAKALGDIAISVNRAAEQATEHGHTLAEEVRILMLHGVLHLLGFDHERDRGAMGRAEKRWRSAYGLPSGLIERSGSQTASQNKVLERKRAAARQST